MKKYYQFRIATLLGVVIFIFMVGCHPKRITWSPNGKWAAWCNDVGLFFTDGDGNVSKNMHENVYRAEWFSDNRRLALETFSVRAAHEHPILIGLFAWVVEC